MFSVLAVVIAAAFAGAAFYINVAEHPARMKLPPAAALAQWKPAYKRGFAMQASLAVAGFLAAAAAWRIEGGAAFLAGGVILLANWPFTLIAIMPVNNRLMAMTGEENAAEIAPLLSRWNRLHAIRTLLGVAATIVLAGAVAQ